MTGKPSKTSGRGFNGSGYTERASVERWARENFQGSATPRDTPLSGSELNRAAQTIERMIVKGARDAKSTESLLGAYKNTLRKIDKP